MTAEDLTDWLETTIDDSFDLGWTSRDAATLIVSRMQAEGLTLIEREAMRERVAKAITVERRAWGARGGADYDRDLADAAIAAMFGEKP